MARTATRAPEAAADETRVEALVRAVARADVAAAALAARAWTHHGRPGAPARAKERAAAALADAEGGTIGARTLALAQAEEPALRSIAAAALGRARPAARAWDLLLGLAADADWEVREWAAGAMGRCAEEAGERLDAALASSSAPVRRAALVAVRALAIGRRRDAACGARLWAAVGPAAADPAPEVVRILGPYVLGDGLVRLFPEEAARCLGRYAGDGDRRVRATAARALGAAGARALAPPVRARLLARLAEDPDGRVAAIARRAYQGDRAGSGEAGAS